MNTHTRFFLSVGLIVAFLGVTYYLYSTRSQEPLPVFAATIDRDCAPWDGGAFTVSIPTQDAVIKVSIYQSADIRSPVKFTFPDESGQSGSAYLMVPAGVSEALSGQVSFRAITQETSVEGRFDLNTETGKQFKGAFIAEWGNEIVFCG